MVGEAEHSARLQHAVDLAEGFLVIALAAMLIALTPIVHVAEGEHQVGAPARHAPAGGAEHREDRSPDLAVKRGIGGYPLAQAPEPLIVQLHCPILAAALGEIGREYLRIPAARRPDL